MLRCLKPITPAMTTNGSRTARNLRCLSANAMTPFIENAPLGGARSSSSRLGRAVDEQASACHDPLAGLQPMEHFHHAVADTTSAYLTQSEVVVAFEHPYAGRI